MLRRAGPAIAVTWWMPFRCIVRALRRGEARPWRGHDMGRRATGAMVASLHGRKLEIAMLDLDPHPGKLYHLAHTDRPGPEGPTVTDARPARPATRADVTPRVA